MRHTLTVSLLCIVALGMTAPIAAQEPGRPEQSQVIIGRNGLLTVRAHRAPLGRLLRLIAARTGVGVAVAGDLDARVTADLTDVEPGDAIRQLVKSHATVWISQPAANRPGAGSDSTDDRARARSVRALGAVKTPEAAATLHAALGDSVSSVRIQAVHALARSQGAAAAPTLGHVAANDPDPRVRLVAVRVLSSLPGAAAKSALEIASRDSDASVRAEAARRLGSAR